jgi:hypothetical protein
MFLIGAVAVFRIHQLTTSQTDMEIAYGCLKNFRGANNERCSFQESLKLIGSAWRDQQIEKEREQENVDPAAGERRDILANIPRSTRSNADLKPALWGNPKIGFTPMKKVRAFYSKSIRQLSAPEIEIKNRREDCAGLPLYRVYKDPNSGEIVQKGKGSRGKCARCGAITQMWCGICHTWLCGPHVEMKGASLVDNEDRKFIFKLLAGDSSLLGSGRLMDDCGIVCRNSCWHEWHATGYERLSEKAWYAK